MATSEWLWPPAFYELVSSFREVVFVWMKVFLHKTFGLVLFIFQTVLRSCLKKGGREAESDQNEHLVLQM